MRFPWRKRQRQLSEDQIAADLARNDRWYRLETLKAENVRDKIRNRAKELELRERALQLEERKVYHD